MISAIRDEYEMEATLYRQQTPSAISHEGDKLKSELTSVKAAINYDGKRIQGMSPIFIKDLSEEIEDSSRFVIGLISGNSFTKDNLVMILIKDKDGIMVRVAIQGLSDELISMLIEDVYLVIINPPAPVPYYLGDHPALCNIIYLTNPSTVMLIDDEGSSSKHKVVGNLYYCHHQYEAAIVAYDRGIKAKNFSDSLTGDFLNTMGTFYSLNPVSREISSVFYLASALVLEIIDRRDTVSKQQQEAPFVIYQHSCFKLCMRIKKYGIEYLNR
jgi:hypothetical protein